MHRPESPPGITRRNFAAMTGIIGAAALAMIASTATIAGTKVAKADGEEGGGHRCFLRGTKIWTPSGECAVEDLKANDLVITASGEPKPILWIGRRAYERPIGQQWPQSRLPIRVSRSALGKNTPHRDLYLSEAHALYLDGALIPVGNLINHSTIARSGADLEKIEYFHIKLARHDVIYAEGAACETLLDYWENLGEYNAEPSRSEESPFAPMLCYNGGRSALKGRFRSAISPLIDVRSKLDAVRDELEARAAAASG
jgi:Hint domain